MGSAFSTPRTWVNDEIPDADMLNTHIRDQFYHMKYPPYGASALEADIVITSTSFASINTALSIGLTTFGGTIGVALNTQVLGWGGNTIVMTDVTVDGTRIGPGSSGLGAMSMDAITGNASFAAFTAGVASGAHTIVAVARVGGESAKFFSASTLYAWEVP